jgi:hypothetical protein
MQMIFRSNTIYNVRNTFIFIGKKDEEETRRREQEKEEERRLHEYLIEQEMRELEDINREKAKERALR